MILRHYLAADNESRLYGDFVDWTQSDDFDCELAGPRMLGYDIRQLLDASGQKQIARVLQQQIDPAQPGRLPNEMNAGEPDRALAWLNALMRGLLHT